jgi:hypothetical protein
MIFSYKGPKQSLVTDTQTSNGLEAGLYKIFESFGTRKVPKAICPKGTEYSSDSLKVHNSNLFHESFMAPK